jgi:Ni,Fe-hydrogenase I cytochrome b subunit
MEAASGHLPELQRAVIHPLAVRISHWINAFAILIMIRTSCLIARSLRLTRRRTPEYRHSDQR